MKKLIVKQNEEKPVPVEVLAESIKNISAGVKKLLEGPLNERALLLLIQNAAPSIGSYPSRKVTNTEVRAVLEGIESLERVYIKNKNTKK